ncbi:MAG: hypothetical protein IJ820_00715 [Lachnospiraceae bacterium]|nr:hypothetical protein [Lachnospiraceae bacterium]
MGKKTKKDRKMQLMKQEMEKLRELNAQMEELLDILLDPIIEEEDLPDCPDGAAADRSDCIDSAATDQQSGEDHALPDPERSGFGRFLAATLEELITAIEELPDGILLEVYFDQA